MLRWRRNSQSSQKPVPTEKKVQDIRELLVRALGGTGNPIYVILMQGVDTQASLETQCAAIYEGVNDLISTTGLMTSEMLKDVQKSKNELEGLNFTRTNDKDRENIFSGYLLQQQLMQFFSQSPDVQVFSRNTQILFTTLKNFLKEDNDQLIKSMMALINSVLTKKERKTLNTLKFPVYTSCQSEYPGACNRSSAFDEVLAEIRMNIVDSDNRQLLDCVNNLQMDDSVKFQILKGILSYLGNQCCGETYVEFINLLMGSKDCKEATDEVNRLRNDLKRKVQGLHQQFNMIVDAISNNLSSIKINLSIVSGYNPKFDELNNKFEELKYRKGVMDKKVSNDTSRESMMQLSEEQCEMNAINLEALKLSNDIEEVLTEICGKVKTRNEQLGEIMQMDLKGKVEQLKEFDAELENLSQQADIGELEKQIKELLAETTHIKYLKSDEELLKMDCDDVNSDVSLLQKFNANFEKVEQNVIKIKEAIERKQELRQIMQQAEDVYRQAKFVLEKLEKVRQGLVEFIVNRLQQVKKKLIGYQTGPKLKNPEGAEETVCCFSNEICDIHKQKIKALDQSLKDVESLYETSGQLFVSITGFVEMINLLNSNHSDSSIDERFTKFWSIEIGKLEKIREYLQILNIDSEKLNSFISQLSAVENWLNDKKSFMDSKVDFNSNEIYINAIQTGKVAANQTEEHLNSMKEFLKEAVERIKQKIDDLQREYDERFDEINNVQLDQSGTRNSITAKSNSLRNNFYCGLQGQSEQLQTGGGNLSDVDGQFLNSIAKLFAKESGFSFDEAIKETKDDIKKATEVSVHNSEVAVGIVSDFVVKFVNDHKEDVDRYHDLIRSYNETEQKLGGLRTELYVIDEQRKQPKEILEILQENLINVIDFGECERFLQDHAQAFMTSPSRSRPNPPPEECDKTTTCSLM